MKNISSKKDALLKEKENSPIVEGESLYVFEKAITPYKKDSVKEILCVVKSVDGDTLTVCEKNYSEPIKIKKSDVSSRYTINIGANPFADQTHDVRPVAFALESVIHLLNLDNESEKENKYEIEGIRVKCANWNPYVFVNGEKKYYQREFVWSLRDKQNLIESIYQNIDCGKILVRHRGWDELKQLAKSGETELFWNDIVDGKQRMDAVRGFINDEFPDLSGNYYSDLSFRSQNLFIRHQLFSFCELGENTSDEVILKQFLKLNFAGVPQSTEHIEYVKSLLN